jgi:hypothetical protein
VTLLKKMMLEEVQLRNYAQNTIRHYLRAVEDFARHFKFCLLIPENLSTSSMESRVIGHVAYIRLPVYVH